MDRPGAPAEAVRPLEGRLAAGNVELLLKSGVLLGAALAVVGAFLPWGYELALPRGLSIVPGDSPRFLKDLGPEERGTASLYGWLIVASGVASVALVRLRIRGVALCALPAMIGGAAIAGWYLLHSPPKLAQTFEIFGELPVDARWTILVPFAGCAVVGAASLVALGLLLGRRATGASA